MNYNKKLQQYLSTCSGRVSDVFYELYNIIDSFPPEEQPNALKYLCETAFTLPSDSSNNVKEYYTEQQLESAREKIQSKFVPLLDDYISQSSKSELASDEVYKHIWDMIQSKSFKTKREHAVALYFVADHKLIPYRRAGIGISMSEDDYTKIINSISKNILPDALYILKLDYHQKTQRASLILKKLLELGSFEEQTVYLTIIMEEIANTVRDNVKEVLRSV